MTDDELARWWPELGTVVAALRRSDRPGVADLLLDAVGAGGSSGEILGGIGAALRAHRALRSTLDDSAVRAWDAVMADVSRAYPGARLAQWFARLLGR